MAHTALEVVKTYAASFATLFGTPHTQPRDAPVDASVGSQDSGVIYLSPARRSGARLVLLPLLPPLAPKVDLPSELWGRCLHYAMDLTRESVVSSPQAFSKFLRSRKDLLLVSKMFKVCRLVCYTVAFTTPDSLKPLEQNLASPLLYSEIKIHTLHSLELLHHSVTAGDRRWDNLRRIPHSTPGRWIQSLDISALSNDLTSRSARFKADTFLMDIFHLTPFLTHLISDPKIVISGRVMKALCESHTPTLRVLKGFAPSEDCMYMPSSPWLMTRDPLIFLIRSCAATLEVLEVVGPGATQDEDSVAALIAQRELVFSPIHLTRLHTLALAGVPCSPLFYTLLHSAIPSLVRLTFTIYPSRHSRDTQSPSAAFLAAHGHSIESLILATPPDWPPPDYVDTFTVPPQGSEAYFDHSILHILPRLARLNLAFPLPPLLLIPNHTSPLRTLLFPRPIPALLPFVLEMANVGDRGETVKSRNPSEQAGLRKVVWTKARWLRSDVGAASRMARVAGDQSEMIRWRRALAKSNVQLVDADGKAV